MTQPTAPPSQQVLVALKEARARLEVYEKAKYEPIAIIGIGCRFPGANNPAEFWQLLRNGVDAVRDIPADRWDVAAFYDPNPDAEGKIYTKQGGFLDCPVDQFDPYFFGIAPREADAMDPQQRLLLEVCWEALEHAGQAPDKLRRTATGVFVGLCLDDYLAISIGGDHNRITPYSSLGTARSVAAGRIAYILGLQGPTLQLDTACSSSLVALHLACQSLRNGECNLALAGGVNLILSPLSTIGRCKLRAISTDGRCKTFAADANGYGQGEGCGVVILKRLSDAQADGDSILAVIRGSAVNHDGPSSGLTVPNELAQEQLIRQALKNARLKPQDVSYVEAHGTGTVLGDPIEVNALGAVFRQRTNPLLIGSVKSNIGHLEGAAGVACLIKVALALHHGEIPPHLHFDTPNPYIDWANLPLKVVTQSTAWPTEQRIAGISSFGLSGTNAHVLVEAAARLGTNLSGAPTENLAQPQNSIGAPHRFESERPAHLLCLSAKTPASLHALAASYADHLTCTRDALGDICATAYTGRSHFPHRLSVVASTASEMAAQLHGLTQAAPAASQRPASAAAPKIAFLFTGQGSQFIDMGRQLYETQPTFRQTLERCDEILRPLLGESLLALLYPDDQETKRPRDQETARPHDYATSRPRDLPRTAQSKIQNPKSKIDETAYTQPALFAIEYALAALWKSWGITPTAVMGHSVGEYVAACVAGVFSLEDGLKLIAERGRLMQALPQDGNMVAVLADEATVSAAIQPYLKDVSIAAVNGPQNIVISGRRQAIQQVTTKLNASQIQTKPLTVSHAFHSPLMELLMIDDFVRLARQITYKEQQIPLVSNLTGKVLRMAPTADYWCRHIRQPVLFQTGMETLHELDIDAYLEIGPKPILLGLARQCLDKMTRGQDDKMTNDKMTNDKMTRWQDDKMTNGKMTDLASAPVTPSSGHPVTLSSPHPVIPSSGHPVMLPSLRPGRDDWQQMLESLGELYGRGALINWAGLEQGAVPRRVSLPTYAFQRERYWFTEKPVPQPTTSLMQSAITPLVEMLNRGDVAQLAQALNNTGKLTAEQQQWLPTMLQLLAVQQQQQLMATNLQDALYQLTWEPQSHQPTNQSTNQLTNQPTGKWLILADKGGVAIQVAVRLRERGLRYVLVYADKQYGHRNPVADEQWHLDPANPQDFVELLQAHHSGLQGIIHLWSMDLPTPDVMTDEQMFQAQEFSCGTLLHLVQALLKRYTRRHASTPRIWLVTHGLHPVTAEPDAQLAIEQAPVWGLGKGVALEHPEIWGGLTDLSIQPGSDEIAQLVGQMLESDGENQLAWRNGQRYVARLAPTELPLATKPMNIQTDATYLITGGLGKLGLRLAHWLVNQGARSLVLLGRRGATGEAEAAVRGLEAAGVTVHIAQSDVTDPQAMRTLMADLQALPPLRGVIHAASVAGNHPVESMELTTLLEVLRAKVAGGWLLHQLTRSAPLDFFVLFSSIASIWGSKTQAHYTAANQFLDGLAHYRRQLGLPALCINWGPWAGSLNAEAEEWLRRNGLTPFTAAQNLAALAYLLKTETAQITFANVDWERFKRVYEAKGPQPLLTKFGSTPQAEPDRAPHRTELLQRLETAPPQDRYTYLITHLQEQVAGILGARSLPEPQIGFAEMGMDSLMAVELKNRLEGSLGHALPSTLAFNYPNIGLLAQHLLENVLALESATGLAATSGLLTPTAQPTRPLPANELLALLAQESAAVN